MIISHVAVYSKNIDESIKFYEFLGGKESARVEIPLPDGGKKTLVHVAFGDAAIELVCPSDGAVKVDEGVVGHFCLECDDIEDTYEMLKNNGVKLIDEKPTKVGALGIAKKLFVYGPSGEIIEFIEKIK